MKVFGPIFLIASYRKDTDQDFFAGLSVQFMYQTLPDANGKINEFKAWVKISENTSLLCEPVNKPDATIWDDDADQPSTSTGSGTMREVTPGVASDSQAPAPQTPAIKEELKAMQANMEELDMIDSLDEALNEAEPEVQATSSTTPVDERRRKKGKEQD